MPSRKLKWCLFTLLLIAMASPSLATHLRAAEVQVKRDDCSSLTVEVIITVYVNYFNTNVKFGGANAYVDFGDGTRQPIPEMDHEIIDPELFIGRVQYKTTHTYSASGLYKIVYLETNRNAGIVNFDNSVNTAFSTETTILLDPQTCNNSPTLLVPPIDLACSGVKFFHHPAALDPDGDSLSYELVVPQAQGGPVTNYLLPNHSKFYSAAGIPYEEANEEKNGPPSFMIDEVTGLITWDAPGAEGEYVIAFKITEWRYSSLTNSWYMAGYMIRDMAIIVQSCENLKPQLEIPLNLCVTAGTAIQLEIPASDPDGHNVVIEGFSEVFSLSENKAVLEPESGTVQSTNPPHDTASVYFRWQTTCGHIKEQPYKVVFKISDRPPTGPRLVQFYTLNIKIIAPAPEYEKVAINPITKTVTLQWKDYACENVQTFQVWRRISEFQYQQPDCDNGMPESLRYQLMAEADATESSYTDSNLAFGAQYCYRIVALIGGKKVPGRISIDTCFIPKPAEAPVITNVSVETTGEQNGEVLIRWTKPFEIDRQQYPPPYHYKVLRKIETDPLSSFRSVTTEMISDTVFTDTGLNTTKNIFRYAIELYVPALTTSPVDTSSQASSVFARTQPVVNGIEISWKANTPWYNYARSHPYHLIYRSDSPSGPFDSIASVNVNENDFHYTDRGAYNSLGLTGKLYFYKVKTRGTYGNRKIVSPLENFSQITSGQVLDTIPPCEPVPQIVKTNCAEFPCGGTEYHTKLVWQMSDAGCDLDVTAYEILVQTDNSNVYTVLGTVTANEFLHTGLNSLDKCYRLISIDHAGNRSDTSAVVCNSNCLNFKLPNVITPGVKDEENDYLTTYPEEDHFREDCSRSVKQVDIRIYSRWGDEIFTTTLMQEETPVFWNGRTNDGQEAASGIYFYHARVIFDTNDPSLRNQQFKGWVHVIR